MARVESSSITSQPFVADVNSVEMINGATIDWANVGVAYTGDDGEILIPAGTIMARTTDGFLPRADSGADTAVGILVSNAYGREVNSDALSGYGIYVGGVLFSNLLPDAGDADIATWMGELNTTGVANFAWATYTDSRSS